MTKKLFLALLLTTFFSIGYSHPGGIDKNGGHHDRKTGGYHCHKKKCFDAKKEKQKPESRVKQK